MVKEKVIDAYLDPVNHYIMAQSSGKPWGTKIDVIPEIFSAGEDVANVRATLIEADYKNLSENMIWGRYKDKIGSGREAYILSASTMVCNIERYVFIEFDSTAKLSKASAAVNERGCL